MPKTENKAKPIPHNKGHRKWIKNRQRVRKEMFK